MPAIDTQPIMSLRREELRRRVKTLPDEVAAWKKWTTDALDMDAHFSQLAAIAVLMEVFGQQQTDLLQQLSPASGAAAFETSAFTLVKSIIQSQRVWDFFRSKLDLRFSPVFKDVLWVADTIAWDCYRPVLEGAADQGILPRDQLREPPLTYLTAEFSPATWVRGSRPNDGRNYDLGTATLPIPVIQVPWDHVANVWELLSLHHEVGHDLEADLKLRPRLQKAVAAAVAGERQSRWMAWQPEVIADLIGLQLAGPAYTEMLMNLLLLPAADVTPLDVSDPHPTHYPRILMNAAYIRTLVKGNQALLDHAQRVEDIWLSFYGTQPQFDDYISDFPDVFAALMDQGFDELKGKSLRDLLPYTAADDARIRGAAGYILTGRNKPAQLRPRHCVSAARLAVSQTAQAGTLDDALLDQINLRTARLARDNAPKGVRAGDSSAPHRKFIAQFVTAGDLLRGE